MGYAFDGREASGHAGPAKQIRRRSAEAQEEALLQIAWWDRDHHRFGAAIPDFRDLPIEAFIET